MWPLWSAGPSSTFMSISPSGANSNVPMYRSPPTNSNANRWPAMRNRASFGPATDCQTPCNCSRSARMAAGAALATAGMARLLSDTKRGRNVRSGATERQRCKLVRIITLVRVAARTNEGNRPAPRPTERPLTLARAGRALYIHTHPDRRPRLPAVQKVWQLVPHDRTAIERLAGAAGISPVVAQLLLNRKLTTPEAARRFLDAPLTGLHHPS